MCVVMLRIRSFSSFFFLIPNDMEDHAVRLIDGSGRQSVMRTAKSQMLGSTFESWNWTVVALLVVADFLCAVFF